MHNHISRKQCKSTESRDMIHIGRKFKEGRNVITWMSIKMKDADI